MRRGEGALDAAHPLEDGQGEVRQATVLVLGLARDVRDRDLDVLLARRAGGIRRVADLLLDQAREAWLLADPASVPLPAVPDEPAIRWDQLV